MIADQDYVAERGRTAEDEIAEVLGGIKATKGVYAVLGNHDWWHGEGKFEPALASVGIKLLTNEAVLLDKPNLWLVGVGDHYTGHSDPQKSRKPCAARCACLSDDA